MRLEEQIQRGTKADALLTDPDLSAAFDSVRQAILDKIEQAPLRDADGVHQLRLMLKLLRDVRANLETAVRDGKMAAHKLKIEQERGSLLDRFKR